MKAQHEPSSHEAEETTRVYLKSALEHMLAAGRSVRDMVEFSLERLGDGAIPQLKRFFDDVQTGQIKIKGLPKGTREALFGLQMSSEEREDLVRLAAYVRAERRGFIGGSRDEDWREAEREVEAMLAERIGLVAKGRRAVSDAGMLIDREVGDVKAAISAWLAGTDSPSPAAETAVPDTPSASPAPSVPPAKPVAKKTAAEKKAAKQEVSAKGAETAASATATKAPKPPEAEGARKVVKSSAATMTKKTGKKSSKK